MGKGAPSCHRRMRDSPERVTGGPMHQQIVPAAAPSDIIL
jgi:hypothetical protein